MKRIALLFTMLLSLPLYAKEPIDIILYDVDKLYDTIPSRFYDDKFYTPKGRGAWNTARYHKKIKDICEVIDQVKSSVVILFGVESEDVVRDIVVGCSEEYSYIHRTLDYYDGLDFAILYFGDRLFVERVTSNNYALYARCEIDGQVVDFTLSRVGRRTRSLLIDERLDTGDMRVAWGKFSRDDLERLGLDDPLRRDELQGRGDSRGEYSWIFDSRVGTDIPSGWSVNSGVFITRWLLTNDQREPLATYQDGRYIGGYSSHLPIYLEIKRDALIIPSS